MSPISRLPTDPSPASLPPGYGDPSLYLSQDRYNHRLSFRPSWLTLDDSASHTVSYACVGADQSDAIETVVWVNGLGGHRLAAALLDGIFALYRIRLIHIDRPGAGHSTSVPLSRRFQWNTEAILLILSHIDTPSTFSLLSHSNGLLYSLHLLLHLPPDRRVRHWLMSSAYVPPWLSGSLLLGAARWLPQNLTGSLGGLASFANLSFGWIDSAQSFSVGATNGQWTSALSAAAWTPSALGASSSPMESSADGSYKKRKQYERFVRKHLAADPEARVFGGLFNGPDLFAEGLRRAGAEGLGYMGDEALVSLKKGEGDCWGWPKLKPGEVLDEMLVYERGFTDWIDMCGKDRLPRIRVGFGTGDAMIPQKGREYLKRLLVNELGLVRKEEWVEVEGAGHDETIGLTCIIEPWLQAIVEE